MFEFKLPDVGEGIHEAEVLKWLVNVGDIVRRDQPVVEVQTDKAVVELPSPVAGQVAELRAPAGKIARVGDVLVVIKTEDGGRRTEDGEVATTPPSLIPNPNPSSPRRILAAPAVRKLALELGVDLARVTGSGPVGRVLPEDVRRFVEEEENRKGGKDGKDGKEDGKSRKEAGVVAPPPTSLPGPTTRPAPDVAASGEEPVTREPLQGLRRRIAERMEQAWRVPHVTSFEDADASRLVALRQMLQPEAERRGVHLTYMPFFIKIAVQVLQEFPLFNATLDMTAGEILVRRYYHIGVATAIPEGLVVPVVRHADRLSLLEIAAELGRLAERARSRALSVQELGGGTFTITNFGSFGGQQGTPIINPPEVAILGCGRIEDRAVVVEGRVEARPVLPLALSFDHRLIDGAAAAAFLGRVKALVVNPEWLLLNLA
ncbi:MAG: 2-oxo acid dehydrogenase subunit E2 [Anaerolineae bacterium]|nr:2-oxo acid dehydrogenase subunit E2 [Anaerolineae bacterium]